MVIIVVPYNKDYQDNSMDPLLLLWVISSHSTLIDFLVLQRYKSSSKTMQPVDDTPVKDYFLGGYRHGHQNDYENQAGIDAIPAPV